VETTRDLFDSALTDLDAALSGIGEDGVERLVDAIEQASHVAVYGCGREGLQMRGLAMRLYHLGKPVSVVGDMTTRPVGRGDLMLLSTGTGMLATVKALAEVAREAGARVLTVTAQPAGTIPLMSDDVVVIPAQTMATDQSEPSSVLPMGSVFEGALFVLFEIVILKLKERMGVSTEAMRANHTNLE
jgi:6-phospho-3-hexuloisomerase